MSEKAIRSNREMHDRQMRALEPEALECLMDHTKEGLTDSCSIKGSPILPYLPLVAAFGGRRALLTAISMMEEQKL